MKFFRVLEDLEYFNAGEIICTDSHTNIVTVANPITKTVFHTNKKRIRPWGDYFEPITLKELNKIKPHLLKNMIPLATYSFNEFYNDLLPGLVCYKCGSGVFSTKPDPHKINKVGKCKNCGIEKQNLYSTKLFNKQKI